MSALVSAPEITGIVVGSTIKGVITGVLIGLIARKLKNLALGVVLGGLLGLLIALPVAILNRYYWQVMLPGTVLGLIVGYATQRYGAGPANGANPSASRAP